MTMRAIIEANSPGATDPDGQPYPSAWIRRYPQPVPCRAWAAQEAEQQSETTLLVTETIRMVTARKLDEDDRVRDITDRNGFKLFPGIYNVRSAQWKSSGIYECVLEKVH